MPLIPMVCAPNPETGARGTTRLAFAADINAISFTQDMRIKLTILTPGPSLHSKRAQDNNIWFLISDDRVINWAGLAVIFMRQSRLLNLMRSLSVTRYNPPVFKVKAVKLSY